MSNKQEYKLIDKISLNYYLMITKKWNRKKCCIPIEQIYIDLMKKHSYCMSDLINNLLEIYFKELGLLDVKEIIIREHEENKKN